MTSQRPRILVIRGGALGDFILTLPALRLLREAFPNAEIELLAYPHIASLADGRFYADRVRSIDYGPLAGFFAKNGTLDPALSAYFAGFQQVVSYLFDPDSIFETNVRKAGVRNYLAAYRRPQVAHAAREWAKPLEALALYLENPAAQLFLTKADGEGARKWLGEEPRMRLAIHPGSGSPRKNWSVSGWAEVGERFWRRHPEGELVLVGGEADEVPLAVLNARWAGHRVRQAFGLPLPALAAVLHECRRFAGHDTGVSHLAAAAGTRCLLLFGATPSAVWAPLNEEVEVLQAPEGELSLLDVETVWSAIQNRLLDP